ncbi:MAG: hypothetical protein NTV29_15030 [Planctomycetota bacterium]|nr:hypothetical protein [Planctomycetota bacterium]
MNRSPQECIEGILRFSDDPKHRAALGSMLLEVQSTSPSSHCCLQRLVRFVESSSDRLELFQGWMQDPESLRRLGSILSMSDASIDWLGCDPEVLGWIRRIESAGDPIEQARGELELELQGALEEALALGVLRRYYHRERLRHTLAYRREELLGPVYLTLLSDTARVVLRCVCDRVLANPGKSEVAVGVLALREFANGPLLPEAHWPVLAIYQPFQELTGSQRSGSDRASARWASEGTLQQAAEKQIERIGQWVDWITDGSVALSWPCRIPSIEVFSGRVSHWRSFLDALPSHATALHAPMLLDAQALGGDLGLCERFLDESKSILFPSFRTEVDIEYLAGYFGAAIGKIQRVGRTPCEALDGLMSIDSIVQMATRSGLVASRHSPNSDSHQDSFLLALDEAFDQVPRRWLNPDVAQGHWDDSESEEFCQRALHWFEQTYGSAPIESRLAQSILLPCPLPSQPNDPGALGSGWTKFTSLQSAQQMLEELAQEQIAALSSRNCRFHFSRIADSLVDRVGKTPSPDVTLRNIVATGKSLGGKGVLWELFSSHALLMDLYIRLCGTSPYLVQILVSNPGMIDDLLDSLMLERIPDYPGFESALGALCKGPHEIESVVLSFRNAIHLAIGVRDILGRENITEIHRALADVHEVCLHRLATEAYRTIGAHQATPRNPDGTPVDYAVLLVGKLASREPNYHSDISMLILYDSPVASHGVFFQQVAQKLIQMSNRVTRFGRLFELKAWQPMGPQGSGMAWNPSLLLQSIERSELHIEHRMNLYTARVIGESAFAQQAESAIERFLHGQEWGKQPTFALVEWRRALELSASPENIKRGWGGTLDVEVLVHSFYAKHLHKARYPWLRGTVERLEALRKNGVISPQVALLLRDAYHFLRSVESGLRLMNTKLRHDLPKDPLELSKLAYILQLPDREQLVESCEYYRKTVQELAQRHYAQWRSEVIASAPLNASK